MGHHGGALVGAVQHEEYPFAEGVRYDDPVIEQDEVPLQYILFRYCQYSPHSDA